MGLPHPPLCRIDFYVDSKYAETFFISMDYCDQMGLASVPEVSFVDVTEFDTHTAWIRGMVPCCGVCFSARYPNVITAPCPRPVGEMRNGYTIATV